LNYQLFVSIIHFNTKLHNNNTKNKFLASFAVKNTTLNKDIYRTYCIVCQNMIIKFENIGFRIFQMLFNNHPLVLKGSLRYGNILIILFHFSHNTPK